MFHSLDTRRIQKKEFLTNTKKWKSWEIKAKDQLAQISIQVRKNQIQTNTKKSTWKTLTRPRINISPTSLIWKS